MRCVRMHPAKGEKMKLSNLAVRIGIYALGLLLMALGVALSVNSGLGVSPINSLPYVLSQILQVDMGSCVTGVFCAYTLVQILILRRKFRLIDLTQILFSTLFGYFVNLAKWLLKDWILPGYPGQLVLLALSILFMAAGVGLYMETGLVNMPMEGMTRAISEELLHRPFYQVKIAMDCASVAIAMILSLVFLHHMGGLREGTILCAIAVAPVMRFLQKLICHIFKHELTS